MRESYMHKRIREKLYEEYGKLTVNAAGKVTGLIRIIKLSTLNGYGETGWMDMQIFVRGSPEPTRPKGYTFFIELKAPGKKPSDVQIQRRKEVEALGFNCYCEDSITNALAVAHVEIRAALARARIL